MQTIKTSSIVVLLMTVMYGGYVSLTKEPESLPPEVADLLEFEDDLGIDTGFASTVDGFGSQGNDPQAGTATATIATGPSSDFGQSFSMPIPTKASPPNNQTPSAPASMSLGGPQTGNEPQIAPQSFQANGGTEAPTHGASFQGLPKVTTPAQNVSVDMNAPFQATPGSFQLPAPTSAQDTFDPSTGRSFEAPTTQLPATQSPAGQLPAADNAPGGDLSLPSMDDLPSMNEPQTKLTEQVSLNVDAGNRDNQIALANSRPAAPTENVGLANAFKTADRQYANDQLQEALATLSVFYGMPNLPVTQRAQLLTRLDPLAREVIYSPRHLLEKPHRVGSNETLMEIAQSYNVPWQLLANINGIKDPLVITPGTELKVVRGPFNAQVDLAKRELTIFLGDKYAGRFPIAVGSDPAPQAGTFTVQDKQSSRTFYDRSGAPVAPGDPGNPYGNVWIDLGNQICIHGSPDATNPTSKGCISLAGNFADDLFGILSQGSSVTIRR